MIVYVVTSGEYSDYHINAVFDSKEQAELFCAVHDDDDSRQIEEYDTEKVKLEADKPIKHRWTAYINEEGEIHHISHILTLKDINSIRRSTHWRYHNFMVQVTLDREVSEDKARKIILDRFAEWKYEQLCEELKRWKK